MNKTYEKVYDGTYVGDQNEVAIIGIWVSESRFEFIAKWIWMATFWVYAWYEVFLWTSKSCHVILSLPLHSMHL